MSNSYTNNNLALIIKNISKKFGVDEFFNLTGIPLDPTPSITKIMWWRDNQAEIFDAAQIFALPQTVVLNSLTGDGWYCDDSNGSYLGFMNLKRVPGKKNYSTLLESVKINYHIS